MTQAAQHLCNSIPDQFMETFSAVSLLNIVQVISIQAVKETTALIRKFFYVWCKNNKTRMHSSGMRTACLLTVSQHALHRGGVCPRGCLPGGVYLGGLPWGVSAQRGCLPRGGVCPGVRGCLPGGIPACNGPDRPPPCGQTDTCEILTFANFVCRR